MKAKYFKKMLQTSTAWCSGDDVLFIQIRHFCDWDTLVEPTAEQLTHYSRSLAQAPEHHCSTTADKQQEQNRNMTLFDVCGFIA